ncbi:NUC169 domain-containing protein [Phakopsora pachyrhizi]|uniref:Ribosome biogenesis protein ERB1 n=1 Tax=Phakopsora pachyrhizi TaxID=170000 RepID=A0AAV0BG10_PHAPC|nr:NUC169 domain-containing protein [Phakopsora pachyrhizi]CAH7686095.1 NUC169 domain-domain-containing protein [Phakopsora pachyrhizi]
MPNRQATSNKAQKKKIHHDNSSGKSKSSGKRKLNHEAESAKNDDCLELFSNPNLDSSKRDLSSKSRGKQKEVSDVSDQSEAEIDSSNNSDSELDEGSFPGIFLSEEEDNDSDEEADDSSDQSELLEEDVPDEELGSLLDSSSSDEDTSDLDSFIKRSTVKPDEIEPKAIIPFREINQELNYMKRGKLKPSEFVEGVKIKVWDEIEPGYGSESSTEDAPNRIGNIPAHFYDDMPHIGYDIDGKKIMRPAKGDELDKFLAGIEDPTSWTSVEDKLMQKNVALTEQELDIIHKLAKAENPDAQYDPYEPMVEFFTGKGMEMTLPLSARPEPKRRFIPSKWEHKKVMKIVRAIRQGRIVPNKPKSEKPQFYAIWSNEDQPRPAGPMYMPAPKLKPPGHAESYNPPEEYLFDEEERKAWEAAEPEDRKLDFMPTKYSSLRLVPGYSNLVQERFNRCLDLYLAPRMLRRRPKLDISDPSELLPKLPSPKDLRPFPSVCSVQYVHENGTRTRTVSIDPTGMWVATGSDDGEVRIWECKVGRCAMTWRLGDKSPGPVYSVEWCPDKSKCILSVVVGGSIFLVSPLSVLSPSMGEATIEAAHAGFTTAVDGPTVSAAKWSRASEKDRDSGVLIEITVPGTPKQVTWHRRGDYFASVASEAGNQSVLIHQLSKHQTQAPFRKTKGVVQKVTFHAIKPHLFVATQQYIKVYDLLAQTLIKTLQPGVKWISSLDVHPLGDNVIVGSYDKRLVWHDMDLSERPFKTMKYHQKAIRSVGFSARFPLFLTSSDDGTIQIFHSTVYSDLMMNPLIVPLKSLKGHEVRDNLGVLEAKWHPTEPWVVSVGADGVGRLWCP